MGVINITPDSFSDGGLFLKPEQAICQAHKLIQQGADFLDLGAESTRPGAKPVSAEEQIKRLLPVVEALAHEPAALISIDTASAEVARACLEKGASIINDTSGFRQDAKMASVISQFGAGCVIMHMRGTPETMQTFSNYNCLIEDICTEIQASLEIAEKGGVSREAIMIDPGIGFAKNGDLNFSIIRNMHEFQRFDRPVLIGPSRKSFLRLKPAQTPDERLWSTAACVAICAYEGAHVIRVHDLDVMNQVVKIADKCRIAAIEAEKQNT